MGCIFSCFRSEDIEEIVIRNDSIYDTNTISREASQFLLPRGGISRSSTPSSSYDNSLPGIHQFPSGPLPYDADPRDSCPRQGVILRRWKESSHLHQGSEVPRSNADMESVSGGSKLNMSASDGNSKQKLYKSSLDLSWVKALTNYELCQSSEDEDVCPTCLEDYTSQNPRIMTKCSHHFHLGCIYEWLERSETCPVCNKVMEFNET